MWFSPYFEPKQSQACRFVNTQKSLNDSIIRILCRTFLKLSQWCKNRLYKTVSLKDFQNINPGYFLYLNKLMLDKNILLCALDRLQIFLWNTEMVHSFDWSVDTLWWKVIVGLYSKILSLLTILTKTDFYQRVSNDYSKLCSISFFFYYY